jgi:hypothetical protein
VGLRPCWFLTGGVFSSPYDLHARLTANSNNACAANLVVTTDTMSAFYNTVHEMDFAMPC